MLILKGMEETEQYKEFMSHRLRTKEDVIRQIDKKISEYSDKAKEDLKTSAAFYTMLDLMLHTFRDRIKEAVLFDDLPDWWIYDYDLEYDRFNLSMVHVKEIEIDEEKIHSLGWLCDASYPLIGFGFKTLTAGEYAKLYGVGDGTVRQWIRRGKLRTASKIGNEWRIPILTVPPGRGYEGAQYIWHEDIEGLPEEYSYINDYKLATFFPDKEDKDKFHVLLVSKETTSCEDTSKNKELILNAKEREKLELILIARPEIRYSLKY